MYINNKLPLFLIFLLYFVGFITSSPKLHVGHACSIWLFLLGDFQKHWITTSKIPGQNNERFIGFWDKHESYSRRITNEKRGDELDPFIKLLYGQSDIAGNLMSILR